MSPLDVSRATPVSSSAGKQTVTFDELLETALCHGWVDTQTKRIDEQRYAIRFVPRPPRIELVGRQSRTSAAPPARRAHDSRRRSRAPPDL